GGESRVVVLKTAAEGRDDHVLDGEADVGVDLVDGPRGAGGDRGGGGDGGHWGGVFLARYPDRGPLDAGTVAPNRTAVHLAIVFGMPTAPDTAKQPAAKARDGGALPVVDAAKERDARDGVALPVVDAAKESD